MKTVWLKATHSKGTGIAVSPMRASASRTLVSNGRWVVPPEERPAGWESLGVSDAPGGACLVTFSALRTGEAA